MMKTIDELMEEAEFLQILVDQTRASAAELRQEALREDAKAITYQQELNDIELQLITANGEPS